MPGGDDPIVAGGDFSVFVELFTSFTRYLFSVLALLILLRCARSLLTYRPEPELWAYLMGDQTQHAITHWRAPLAAAPAVTSAWRTPQWPGSTVS